MVVMAKEKKVNIKDIKKKEHRQEIQRMKDMDMLISMN